MVESKPKLVLSGGKTYFRFSNSDAEITKEILKKYYIKTSTLDTYNAVALCTSGMHAINTAITAIMSNWGWSSDVCIVIGDEMYGDTPRSAYFHSDVYTGGAMRVHKVSVQDNDKVKTLFQTKCRNKKVLFLLEPCTNPNGFLFDFSLVTELKKLCKELLIVADNTWTPDMNVLEMGADAIALSLTKHHSGSSCIMGAVITNKNNIAKNVNELLRKGGSHVSPYDCSILMEKISSMEERVSRASAVALKVAEELERRPWVEKVMFPLLKSHPSFELGEIYGIRPTVMNILMDVPFGKVGKEKTEQWLRSREGIYFATSYGGKECRIDPWIKRCPKTNKFWVRLSIGYESTVDQIMKALTKS